MQAQAYEGYFENGRFYTAGRVISIPERRRVTITVMDEPVDAGNAKEKEIAFWEAFDQLAKDVKDEDKAQRAEGIKRLDQAIRAALDEELPDFKRQPHMREPIELSELG